MPVILLKPTSKKELSKKAIFFSLLFLYIYKRIGDKNFMVNSVFGINYVRDVNFDNLMKEITTEVGNLSAGIPSGNSTSSKSPTTNPNTPKVNENTGSVFNDVSFSQIEIMQNLEKEIKSLKSRIAIETDPQQKEILEQQLDAKLSDYDQNEIDYFDYASPNEDFGRKDKYDFYTNLSRNEFKQIEIQNQKISKQQEELDEVDKKIIEIQQTLDRNRAELLSTNSEASPSQKREKEKFEQEIARLNKQKSRIIARMNKEIKALDKFIKEAGKNEKDALLTDIRSRTQTEAQISEEKEALAKVLFDDKGVVKPTADFSDIKISYNGKELDNEIAKEILEKLHNELKGCKKEEIAAKLATIISTLIKTPSISPLASKIYPDKKTLSAERVLILNQIVKILTDNEIDNLSGIDKSGLKYKPFKAAIDKAKGDRPQTTTSTTSKEVAEFEKQHINGKNFKNNVDFAAALAAIKESSLSDDDKQMLYKKVYKKAWGDKGDNQLGKQCVLNGLLKSQDCSIKTKIEILKDFYNLSSSVVDGLGDDDLSVLESAFKTLSTSDGKVELSKISSSKAKQILEVLKNKGYNNRIT